MAYTDRMQYHYSVYAIFDNYIVYYYFFMAFIKASSAVISSCVKPERSIDSFFSNPNRYLATTSKKATTIKVPGSLTVDDITYKVTMVAAKASVYKNMQEKEETRRFT